MFTKISLNQSPSLEPYALPPEVTKAVELPPVKVPSPPPIPAVATKVWALPKPELFPAPAITEAPEPIQIPSPEPIEILAEKEIAPIIQQSVEVATFQPSIPVQQPSSFPSIVPVTTGMSESLVKQSIMKFSHPNVQQQTQAEEKKMAVTSKTITQQPFVQNGFGVDSKTTTESFSSMKQSTFVSESKSVATSGSVSAPKPSFVPVPLKFVPKPITSPFQKEKEKPAQSLVPVWKPKNEVDTKQTWRKVQVPSQTASTVTQKTVESKFISTGIPSPALDSKFASPGIPTPALESKFPYTEIPTPTLESRIPSTVMPTQMFETKFSSTEMPTQTLGNMFSASESKCTSTSSQTAMPSSAYSTESSTTTRTSYSTEQISITKKYEMVLEHSSETISGDTEVKPTPKPIIKKEPKDGPKPKKEVVIEEGPVVGAEVKPPQFSKVRGAESLRRIYNNY